MGLPTQRQGRYRPFFIVTTATFLLVPLSGIVEARGTPLHAGLGILAVVLIVATLAPPLLGNWQVGRTGPVPLATALTIAGIAAFLMAETGLGSWISVFYFAAIVASRVLPERRAMALLAIIGVLCTVSMVAAGIDIGSAAVQGLSVSLIGFVVFSIGTLRRTNAQLLAARDEIARLAVAEERVRIARDLHDTLGHSLSVITLKSELAGRLLPGDPERAKREVADVERVSREALASIRETVGGYRRPTLDNELAEVRASLDAAGIEVDLRRDPDPLPPDVESVLAWAVREGTTNILRHSATKRASIFVGRDGASAAAEVEDAGPLRTQLPSPSDEGRGAGSGIAGLRERAAARGGAVEAGPTPSGGYRLRVRVPMSEAAT
jgi:two-component system sensor histidine kinase DesK